MPSLARTERRIAAVIAGSEVPEDPVHSRNTLKWLLRLDPKADPSLRIAALGHDIERAVEAQKVQRGDFADFDAFKAAHARASAGMLGGILQECGASDETLTREIRRLVCLHEVGGDPRSDLLKDADSLSYFDVNLPLYFERNGWHETRRRCAWGYLRLSPRARSILAGLELGAPFGRLMNESIEAARSLRRSAEPTRANTLPGLVSPPR